MIQNGFERTCKACGLVEGEILDETSYVIRDSDVHDPRGSQYVALGNKTNFVGGLGSFIDYQKSRCLRDGKGRQLPASKQVLFRRLKKNYAKFTRIKDHETEYRIFQTLNKVSMLLDVGDSITENAAYLFRKILKAESSVINHVSLIAFCLFYAIRKSSHHAPITIKEIAEAFRKYGHRVNARLILRDGMEYKHHFVKKSTPKRSEDYLARLLSNVIQHEELDKRLRYKGLSWSMKQYQNYLTRTCWKIMRNLSTWKRGGRSPFILTGAVIYLADRILAKKCGHKAILTQKMVSEATGIAEYSIRDHYVNLLKPFFLKK